VVGDDTLPREQVHVDDPWCLALVFGTSQPWLGWSVYQDHTPNPHRASVYCSSPVVCLMPSLVCGSDPGGFIDRLAEEVCPWRRWSSTAMAPNGQEALWRGARRVNGIGVSR
jgi:hypothetical protein